VSGELAASAIARTAVVARAHKASALYARLWRQELGAELSDAVRVQKYLFASHDRVARVIRGARTSSRLTRDIFDFTRGTLSYSALRRKILWSFPTTVFRMAREAARLS
jgi:flavin-dependent dehydrogenase